MAHQELVDTLQKEYPELYQMLMKRDIGDFAPNSAQMTEVLPVIKRDECRACKNPGAPLQCAACKLARYCDKECQTLDWEDHKHVCSLDRVVRTMLKEGSTSGHLDE